MATAAKEFASGPELAISVSLDNDISISRARTQSHDEWKYAMPRRPRRTLTNRVRFLSADPSRSLLKSIHVDKHRPTNEPCVLASCLSSVNADWPMFHRYGRIAINERMFFFFFFFFLLWFFNEARRPADFWSQQRFESRIRKIFSRKKRSQNTRINIHSDDSFQINLWILLNLRMNIRTDQLDAARSLDLYLER